MFRKKILIYTSDDRGYNEVKNIVFKLSKRDCDYIFIYPKQGQFTYESNIDYDTYPNFESRSIGFVLPFKPDILLITRESWTPETNLIIEFKQAGSIICNLENSSWLYNNIKTRLEILSRMKFPTNMIDVFFDHSEWTYNTKTKAGWVNNKSVIIGLPKFDNLKNTETDFIKQKYNINKPVVILYGSMELNIRPNIINVAKELELKYKSTHQLFYKPHPKEFIDYTNDFKQGYLISSPSFKVIDTESEMASFAKLSDIHVGILSSIMYYPLYFNKPIYYIDSNGSGVMEDLDFEKFRGHEYNFWAPLINVSSWDDFINKIGDHRVKEFKDRYNLFIDTFKKILKPYKNDLNLNNQFDYDNQVLLNFYDNFNDGNASKRVVDYLLNLYN